MGGAIAPGINISTVARPESIIGKNTVAAMQAVILYGYVGQVEGIVNRIKAQSKIEPLVVATGGLATLIANESSAIDIVEPFLTLKGLQLIYKRNREQVKH